MENSIKAYTYTIDIITESVCFCKCRIKDLDKFRFIFIFLCKRERKSPRNEGFPACRKIFIFVNRTNSLSPSPNPFPSLKGCVCLVGSASCRAFWHTRPASVPGLLSGAAAPATLLGASPQTPFYLYKEVYRQSEQPAKAGCFLSYLTP